MIRKTLIAAIAPIAMTLATGSIAAGQHGHQDKPQHGGMVAETKGVSYELVATPASLQLHLRDHGKAMDVAKASAKLTLLSGSDKQEVELRPAGNRLEASGSFKLGAGTKVVAQVNQAGKPVGTVRFVIR